MNKSASKRTAVLEAAVDQIAMGPMDIETKLIRLWAIAMIDYRGPAGDRAWDAMRKVGGVGQTSAIAFLTGWAAAGGAEARKDDRLLELVPELREFKASL